MNEQKIKGLTTELQCQTYFTQKGYNVQFHQERIADMI